MGSETTRGLEEIARAIEKDRTRSKRKVSQIPARLVILDFFDRCLSRVGRDSIAILSAAHLKAVNDLQRAIDGRKDRSEWDWASPFAFEVLGEDPSPEQISLAAWFLLETLPECAPKRAARLWKAFRATKPRGSRGGAKSFRAARSKNRRIPVEGEAEPLSLDAMQRYVEDHLPAFADWKSVDWRASKKPSTGRT